MNKFLDLSEHNTVLNYNSFANSGLKGVIIKASEGTTFTDSSLDEKYQGLVNNVNLGFYHYLTVTSEPETQAQHFYDLIKDKSMQIVPVLDVEQESLRYKAESYSERFISEFYRLSGMNMVIYSGRYYIEDNFSYSFCKDHNFWLADYSANDAPVIEKCNKIVAWQYTDNNKDYDFINGEVDCNILIDESLFYIIDENFEVPYSDLGDIIDIKSLQVQLNKQGFTDKYSRELYEDGIVGELTLSACPSIEKGCIGEITKWIQNRVETITDGVFGEETKQAVIVFQENHSLDGDGIVGKNTWRKLLNL